MNSSLSYSFVDPATQTPLFVAEYLACAYPVSDLYASSPRYLYYALLLLVLITQWHSWLANVFLGVVATYAGTAAIEAFILVAQKDGTPAPSTISIPYIDPMSVSGNATLNSIPNLITNYTSLDVQPAVLDFDLDAVLAITVTGYLMVLPMHCWSSAVRVNRARHFLILLWNALMFAGMISSVVLWPTLFDSPLQFRFCYPSILDTDSVTSDGHYDSSLWAGGWNDTIWNIFSNFSVGASLNNNCFYPCFNTTQALRRTNSLVATVDTKRNPRTSAQLAYSQIARPGTNFVKESSLAALMYTVLIITTAVMVLMLIFLLSPIHKLTRVPIAQPKHLLWSARKELFHLLWKEFQHGYRRVWFCIRYPTKARVAWSAASRRTINTKMRKMSRFIVDIIALAILFVAMVLTPVTIVVFVVFIEWYIHRDLVSSEAPAQVGQWTTSVSVALILVSAIILQLKNPMATTTEVEKEISDTKEHLQKLEKLLESKRNASRKKQALSEKSSPRSHPG